MGVALDRDRSEVLDAFILFHSIHTMEGPSMAPDWDQQKVRNSKSPRWQRLEHDEQNDRVSNDNKRETFQNDLRPHAGRSAVPIAANRMTE
jgi:hypothetical protein